MDELYKDLLNDSKNQRHFFMVIVAILIVVVMLSVGGMIGLSMYYQHKMTTILEETNTVAEYELTTDNNSFNNGNITVTR